MRDRERLDLDPWDVGCLGGEGGGGGPRLDPAETQKQGKKVPNPAGLQFLAKNFEVKKAKKKNPQKGLFLAIFCLAHTRPPAQLGAADWKKKCSLAGPTTPAVW